MKHRGVSEVIGSVIMLGIVGTIAALVLTIGLSSITNFQTFLIDVDISEDTLKERLVINNVDFKSDGNFDVKIYVRNVGLNQVIIESIAIIDIDTQEVIFLDSSNTVNVIIQPKTKGSTDDLLTNCDFTTSNCTSANYNIAIVTARGNIFEMEVKPFRL